MPSAEDMTKTIDRYLECVGKGAPDEIAELYADDATVEDPVGGEVHIGRQAIRGFYTNVEGIESKAEIITLRALGHEVAFYWKLTVGGAMQIDIISVMTFTEDAKIASMKAYWGPENITQL